MHLKHAVAKVETAQRQIRLHIASSRFIRRRLLLILLILLGRLLSGIVILSQ